MRWTRASVEEDAIKKGLELVVIEGIPEGFSWKEPDVTIDEKVIPGKYVLYGPLGFDVVRCDAPEDLLKVYGSITIKEIHPQNHAKVDLERARSETKNKEGN